jgi:hypothetical protein
MGAGTAGFIAGTIVFNVAGRSSATDSIAQAGVFVSAAGFLILILGLIAWGLGRRSPRVEPAQTSPTLRRIGSWTWGVGTVALVLGAALHCSGQILAASWDQSTLMLVSLGFCGAVGGVVLMAVGGPG